MCLYRLTPFQHNEVNQQFWWKVFRPNPKGFFGYHYHTNIGIYYQPDNWYEAQNWSLEIGVGSSFRSDTYRAGFHCYSQIEDATRAYRSTIRSTVVVGVQPADLLAYGIEHLHGKEVSVGVFRWMKIIGKAPKSYH